MSSGNKSDWKLFREKIADWQNNYMLYLLEKYSQIINSNEETVDKFWELEKQINEDKKKCGVVCEFRPSLMLENILRLFHEGAITLDDLKDFSEELQNSIRSITR